MIKKQHSLIWLVFFITPLICFGDNTDTTCIKEFDRKYNIQSYSYITDISLLVNPFGRTRDFGISLQPNVKGQAGLALGFQNFTVAFSVQIPGTESNELRFGKSQYFDFSFGYYKRKFGGEIYYRYFQGMFRSNNDFAAERIRPDIYVNNGGLNVFYAANHKKFSMRSAFSQQEQQIKSAGSFVLLSNFQFRSLIADSSIIPKSIDNDSIFSDLNGLEDMRFYTLSFRPGYAYNFVSTNGRWFFAPAVFAGMGTGWYTSKSNVGYKSGLPIELTFHAKVFTGYNHNKWFLSVFYAYDGNVDFLKNSFVNLNTHTLGINLAYRLKSIGIKSKWL